MSTRNNNNRTTDKTEKPKNDNNVPKMKEASILTCLKELGITYTKEDFVDPKPETTKQVFHSIMTYITGEKDSSPNFYASNNSFRWPELHVESVPEFEFLKQFIEMMKILGVDDFSVRDIVQPEKTRNRRNLAALINYLKFRHTKLSLFHNIEVKTLHSYEHKCNLETEVIEEQGKLQTLMNQRELERPQLEELKEQVKKWEQLLKEKALEREKLALEYTGNKKPLQEYAEKISSIEHENNQKKQVISKIKSQIVDSPELRQTIKNMKGSLKSQREHIEEINKNSQDLQGRVDLINKLEEEISLALKMLEEVGSEMNKVNKLNKETKEAKSQLESLEKENRELNTKEQQLESGTKMKREKTKNLSKKHNNKKSILEKTLEERSRDKQQIEKQKIQVLGSIGTNNMKAQQVEQQIELANQKHQREMESLLQQFAKIEVQVEQYHKTLFHSMKKELIDQ